MATTVMAVILGIILVITIHPGVVGQEKVSLDIYPQTMYMFCVSIYVWKLGWPSSSTAILWPQLFQYSPRYRLRYCKYDMLELGLKYFFTDLSRLKFVL
jgi:hypothetical protein